MRLGFQIILMSFEIVLQRCPVRDLLREDIVCPELYPLITQPLIDKELLAGN